MLVETENTTGSSSDAGDYVLLNKEQQPMNLKMIHLFLVSLAMPSENKAWFSDDLQAITN
jgi:hypothetical protein